YTHTHTHTLTHTHTHTQKALLHTSNVHELPLRTQITHSLTDTPVSSHTHARTHTHTHRHTHRRTQTQTHTDTHTHTHASIFHSSPQCISRRVHSLHISWTIKTCQQRASTQV